MENNAAKSPIHFLLSGPVFQWAFSAAILVITLTRLVPVVVSQLEAPFDLSYESPILTSIKAIQSGKNIYHPDLYLKPPFTLTTYTPFYHYMVASVPASEDNPFLAGRLVAMVFMVSAGSVLLLVEANKPGAFLGVIGISLFFLVWPVTSNTAYLKNDSVALFSSVLAVMLAAHGKDALWKIVLASFLCTVALASKQSYGAATVACFLFFLFNRRKAALLFAASFLVFFVLFFVGGYWFWGEGFWFSIIEAARHPMEWQNFLSVFGEICQQPLFAVVFGSCLVGVVYSLFWTGQFRTSPYGYYALVSWGVLLATLGKVGASTNYVIEPCLASLMFAIGYLKSSAHPTSRGVAGYLACAVLALLVLVDLVIARPENYSYLIDSKTSEQVIQANSVRNKEIRAVHQNPRILNLANSYWTTELPGEVSLSDPFVYCLLWQNEQLSEEGIVRLLNEKYFDLLVVNRVHVVNFSQGRWMGPRWQRVMNAIAGNYRVERQGADVSYFAPVDRPLFK